MVSGLTFKSCIKLLLHLFLYMVWKVIQFDFIVCKYPDFPTLSF